MFKKRDKKKEEDAKEEAEEKREEEEKEKEIEEEEIEESEGVTGHSGPYDISDPDAPEGEYLDLGGLKILGKGGLSMRLIPSPDQKNIADLAFSYGSSSLQITLLASPRRVKFWQELRSDILSSQKGATEKEGTFGPEVYFTTKVREGLEIPTRIVGVDGPRWMLRGIFAGPAAEGGEEKDYLDDFFSTVIANRGTEPLAPGDPVPLVFPPQLLPQNMAKAAAGEGPEMVDVTTKQSVQETLERGPMFTEIR
ncbi:MAG: DUF3710 domain-containing protein [Aeriscardovia sp.]|nr:DUF3710 domain-containing protein [Aeriscardovia sp.]